MSDWISVKDELPHNWIAVLVAVCPTSKSSEVHMALIEKKGDKFTMLDEQGNHADFITHWQALPPPPE